MKNEITILARAFPVTIKDERTGSQRSDLIVLNKVQLQAAQMVGQSSKELLHRMYNQQGYKVLEIGKPTKREIRVDLSRLYQQDTALS